ncbi:MAG: hypothetical protein IJS86_05535, partial [Lachnospiraceae bacterium]|nr:hypothetical protein [Lachnospiraceae bacterium]
LGHPVNSYLMMLNNMNLYNKMVLRLFIYIVILMAVDFAALKTDIYALFGKLKTPFRWIIYSALTTFVIVEALNGGTTQQFIYFQF